MGFTDKNMVCAECSKEFVFSASEQEFFSSRGFTNEPKRCPECRQSRRSSRNSTGEGGQRQMFPAVCSQCGKDTQLPFEPKTERPVYCSDCYSAIKPKR